MKLEHIATSCTKINSKWLKDVNISHNTINLLEQNIGKVFSDINHTNIFLGQSPKAIEIKTKINKWDLIKFTSIFTQQMKPLKRNQKDNLQDGKKINRIWLWVGCRNSGTENNTGGGGLSKFNGCQSVISNSHTEMSFWPSSSNFSVNSCKHL